MQPDAFAQTQVEPGLAKDEPQAKPGAGLSKTQSMVGRMLKGLYRIDALLGQGAMGVVFRGTQLQLDKPVAIKMLRPDGFHGDDALDRFQREATVVSKLVHPSIAQVLDFGVEDGMPFLVMEFVDGKELTEVLELEGPMPPSRAIAVVRQLASALEEAHRHGVVHRDIKPHNLRLMRYTPGGQVFLKVLDFGIAKQLGGGEEGKLTATGAVMGTPAYMPPEQAGGKKVDARADQYATGVVLYELLTGSVPFTGETLTGVLVSHLTKPPPPLPRAVPEPLRRVVMRLLEKNPEDRFPDVKALDAALAAAEPACRDVPALAVGKVKPIVADGSSATTGGRPLTLAVGGSAVLLSVLLLGAVVLWGVRGRKGHPTGGTTPTVVATPTAPPTPAPTPPTAAPPTAAPPTAAPPTAAPPTAAPPTAAPPTAKPAPTVKPAGPAVAHIGPAARPNAAVEPPEVKEHLDEAESELKAGNYQHAIELARRTTFTTPVPRAYRQIVAASCNMGDLQGAKAAFHRVAAGDRKALVALCRKHDIDLP